MASTQAPGDTLALLAIVTTSHADLVYPGPDFSRAEKALPPGNSPHEGKGTAAGARLLRRRVARALHAWSHQGDLEADTRIEGVSFDRQSGTSTSRGIRIVERA